MKNIFTALLILVLGAVQLQAEGIEFFEGSWKEALEKAEKEDKLIFVDAYTTWCGPCKRMAKDIFPLKEVGEFYNANFINMKMDMEKGEGRTIRSKYGVNAFPTFLFVNGSGELQYKNKGGKPAPAFIKMGEEALKRFDNSGQFAEKYEEGDRSPELLYKYAIALAKANKENKLKVANEYLKTQKPLSVNMKKEENLKFLYQCATEADSRLFSLLIDNKDALAKTVNGDAINDRIKKACENTVKKAIKYNSVELLEEAKTKMTTNIKNPGNFVLESDLAFYEGTENGALFIKAADKYLKAVGKNNAVELHGLAARAINYFADDAKVMAKAMQWAGKAAENGGTLEYVLTLANLQYMNKKYPQATKTLEKAATLIEKEKNKNAARTFDLLQRKIKEATK